MTEQKKPTFRREGGNRDQKSRNGGYQKKDGERKPYSRNGEKDGTKRTSFQRTGERRANGGFQRGDARTGGKRPMGNRPAGNRPEADNTPNTTPARRLALEVLSDVHQNGAFANLSLNEKLQAARQLKPEDRRLATQLVYGVLENQIRIDHALKGFLAHQVKEPAQLDILRMGAYQILFLDRVPDSAAVNEAVKLTRAMGMDSSTGFVNAVLRNLARQKNELSWPAKEEDLRAYLHVMTSTPLWLVERLIADYGAEEAEKILSHRNAAPSVTVRPNLHISSDEELIRSLDAKEIKWNRGIAPHAFLLEGISELTYDQDYRNGKYSVQGQSSMLAAEAIQAKPGMRILDACAAPGGKSAYLCETMQMTGRVFAWELHEKRAMLLDAVKRRLHLENLRVAVRDATQPMLDWESTLDAVLLDAPCSGTGVITDKPDIKQRLKAEDIPAIVETQKQLLDTLCTYVKVGGTLVYSTCSILPEENSQQVAAFLERHPNFALETLPVSFPESLRKQQGDYGLQLQAYRDGVEGFFIARLRRMR
ncbi:MAG: 16S rRNA (cytosine(967)-C(5))-methyltransferase RsmB [Clostridiales bacterium]|nr:16S rRNA (cytosine(967)-C(5))-methyltransferase RsmB [Clostridiales bacterium]